MKNFVSEKINTYFPYSNPIIVLNTKWIGTFCYSFCKSCFWRIVRLCYSFLAMLKDKKIVVSWVSPTESAYSTIKAYYHRDRTNTTGLLHYISPAFVLKQVSIAQKFFKIYSHDILNYYNNFRNNNQSFISFLFRYTFYIKIFISSQP